MLQGISGESLSMHKFVNVFRLLKLMSPSRHMFKILLWHPVAPSEQFLHQEGGDSCGQSEPDPQLLQHFPVQTVGAH